MQHSCCCGLSQVLLRTPRHRHCQIRASLAASLVNTLRQPHIPSANAKPMPDVETSDMAITAPKAGMKQTRSFLLSTSCLTRDEVAHSCMMRCTRLRSAGLVGLHAIESRGRLLRPALNNMA